MGGFQTNPGLQGMRQTWSTAGSANYQGYASPVFDALLDSALTTFSAAQSAGYWTRAFQVAIDDVPSLWLYEQRFPIAVHRRVRIPQLRADGWYTNLADWSIDPAQAIARDRTAPAGATR